SVRDVDLVGGWVDRDRGEVATEAERFDHHVRAAVHDHYLARGTTGNVHRVCGRIDRDGPGRCGRWDCRHDLIGRLINDRDVSGVVVGSVDLVRRWIYGDGDRALT